MAAGAPDRLRATVGDRVLVAVTASDDRAPQGGSTDRDEGRPAAESVGERLLGALFRVAPSRADELDRDIPEATSAG